MQLRSRVSALPALLLASLAGSATAQTTWYADDDGPGDLGPGNPFVSDPAEDGSPEHPFDRIQEAIDAAASGDEVLVLPGLYFDFGTIDLSSSAPGPAKALVIRGRDGAGATVIDGSALFVPIFRSVQGETAATVLEGFTARGAQIGTSPGNVGAGMYLSGSSPTVRGCVFEDNAAYSGGGVYASESDSRFEGCVFRGNSASWQGGGLYLNRGHVVLAGCSLEANHADVGGGGLIGRGVASSTLAVRDSVLLGNTSDGPGGGMAKWDVYPLTVERTRFLSNTGTGGGALFVNGGGTVRDCVFGSNTSTNSQGGGLDNWSGGNVVLTGSTFYDNAGFDVWTHPTSVAQVTNCILWSTVPATSGPASIAYSDVIGGGGSGTNLDADPLFVDPWGPDGMLGTLDDDVRLSEDSPCIDAGDTRVPAGLAPAAQDPVDVAGRPRATDGPAASTGIGVLGLTVDLGAHELQPPRAFRQVGR